MFDASASCQRASNNTPSSRTKLPEPVFRPPRARAPSAKPTRGRRAPATLSAARRLELASSLLSYADATAAASRSRRVAACAVPVILPPLDPRELL